MNKKCSNCNLNMVQKGIKILGGDTYTILYCEKCKRQVART